MCEVVAAILQIVQLEFLTTQSTTPAADESGGYRHEGGEDVTVVKNQDVLEVVAAFLGVNGERGRGRVGQGAGPRTTRG